MNLADKLMTLAQAAELCACHPRTLRRAINDGQLTAMRLGQGAKSDRVHAADLQAWWQRSRYVPPSMPAPPKVAFTKPLTSSAEDRIAELLATKRTKSAAKSATAHRRK